MKKARQILCIERASLLGQYSEESVWLLPQEMDWTSDIKSFDLLGTSHLLERMKQCDATNNGSKDYKNPPSVIDNWNSIQLWDVQLGARETSQAKVSSAESVDGVRAKLIQLLHAVWQAFDYQPSTIDQGIVWLGKETVERLLVVAEIFALLEKSNDTPFSPESLWQHSLRTGYLAGLIAKEEQADEAMIVQSCVAGLSHDIGLAILAVSLDSSCYLHVMARARKQNLSLATAELLELGISHEIVGAEFLQRQKFPKTIVEAVSFHDNPLGLGLGRPELTPTMAVYASNILDGGGWPQDSDGVPSDRALEYFSAQGFVNPWQKWQRCVAQLRNQEFRRA